LAAETGAFVIEDDYDGEFRLDGHPVSVLQNVDKNESVVLIGSFNKLLFSSLRVGYMVVPKRLIDTILAFRFESTRTPLVSNKRFWPILLKKVTWEAYAADA